MAEKTFYSGRGANSYFAITSLRAASVGMLTSEGRRGAKRFMKLPLKVNMGLRLHPWHCEDFRLISFRCWPASACRLWAASAHTYALMSPFCSHSIFQTSLLTEASSGLVSVEKNRAASVPTSKNNSFCLRQPYDNTETNGKANIRLISKKERGEECAGEVGGGGFTSGINAAPCYSLRLPFCWPLL